MSEVSTGIQAIDSLSANEFQVELNGEVVTGIFGVKGLCTRWIDMDAGRLVQQPLIITKMIQQNPSIPFNMWTRETLTNPSAKITRQLAVVAMDEGVETRRWVVKDAWISGISFSDFNSGSQVLIEEQLVIQHDGIEEIWP